MRRSLVISLLAIVGVAVLGLGATIAAGNSPLLGLDLQGGASLVLKPQAKVSSGVLDQAISIIRKRVDALGVAEPNISRQGSNVVIELPGIKDPQSALNVVGKTAELRFRPVLCTIGPEQNLTTTTTTTKPGTSTTTTPATTTTTKPASTTTPTTAHALGPIGAQALPMQLASSTHAVAGFGAQTATTAAPAATTATTVKPTTATTTPSTATTVPAATAPTTPAQVVQQACTAAATSGGGGLKTTLPKDDPSPSPSPASCAQTFLPGCYVILPDAKSTTTARYVLGPTELTGSIVRTAIAQAPTVGGDWSVQVNFTGSGSPKFDAMAAKYVQKQVAIVLDGAVESAPTIQQATFNGTAQITGTFTQKDANNLALQLRYGSLPVQFQPQSIQTVSATLGKDSLRAGLLAGGIGLALVLLYMIAYYRALGLVVVLGLGVSGMLLYAIISTLSQSSGLALSLAGATGIIVSVGVTADSYIVYFERLKDEIRSGKTVRSSVDRGFVRAYRTIVAADLVSLLAAAILYLFTVSSVRGFAFFLGLSTLLDLITAYLFTRPMVVLLGRNRTFTEARFLGVARGLAVSASGGPA
jgi:preprotein translocase subunit SecD